MVIYFPKGTEFVCLMTEYRGELSLERSFEVFSIYSDNDNQEDESSNFK